MKVLIVTAAIVAAIAALPATATATTITLNSGLSSCVATTDANGIVSSYAGTAVANGVTYAGTCNGQPATPPVAPAPPGSCVVPGLTRQSVGRVTYTLSGTATRDLTQWNDIWGHLSSTDAAAPWPGRSASSPVLTLSRSGFIAAQFVVPNGVSQTNWGAISHTTYSYGLDVTAAISKTCGDFNPVPACVTYGANSGPFPVWQTAPVGSACKLSPGTYYLNIKITRPTEVRPMCSAQQAACPLGTQLNYNP